MIKKTNLNVVNEDYECSHKIPVIALSNITDIRYVEYLINVSEPSCFIFDEDIPFINTKEFSKMINSTPHYYVFITREPLTCLPISIDSIYTLSTKNKCTVNKPFIRYKENIFLKESNIKVVSTAITEDSKFLIK